MKSVLWAGRPLCADECDCGGVVRLNPKLATRGHLLPGEPLYVRMPSPPARRIERELMALRDSEDA